MKEIIACEMVFEGELSDKADICCVPFQEKNWEEYRRVYNECFCEMRRALEVEPVNFYSDYGQMKDKARDTYLHMRQGVLAGAVSCYGNEVDDLFVNKAFQGKGLGRKLLLWGMNRVREQGSSDIILHVAEWNQIAVKLYLETGFVIRKKEKVR